MSECTRAGIVWNRFSEQEIFRLGARGACRHLSRRLQGGRLGWGQRRHARRRRCGTAEAMMSCECDRKVGFAGWCGGWAKEVSHKGPRATEDGPAAFRIERSVWANHAATSGVGVVRVPVRGLCPSDPPGLSTLGSAPGPFPARLLGGAHRRARGRPAGRGPAAAAADRERRLRQPGHGGLHHAPARGQPAGPGAVRAAAAGRWRSGEPPSPGTPSETG